MLVSFSRMLFNFVIGGVGFDINCGVRLLRTNLDEKDVKPVKEQLAQVSVQMYTRQISSVQHVILISNTRDCVLLGYPSNEKKVENMTYSRALFQEIQGVWVANETLTDRQTDMFIWSLVQ